MADELSILMRLRGARRANAELEGTARNINRIEGAAKRAARPIGAMSKSLDRTGTMLTRNVSLPLAIAGGAAVKMGFDYEQTMTRVSTLTDASAGQVKAWNGQLLELAKQTGVAPRELAEALYFTASSGLRLTQVMGAMNIIAKGAALGLGDTATIAQLVTSAMNAYSDSNLTAAQAMDTLIGGTKAGKLEAADLSEVLGRVLPLASRLGVPLKGVVASMEAMSMTGADAEQAATQVSALMSQLIRPQAAGEKALKKVGLTYRGLLDDLKNPRIGLLGVVKLLDRAFNGDIIAQGQVFKNIRALRAQLGLTGDQGAKVEKVFRDVNNSSGATGKAWAKLSESDAFKLRKGIVAIQVAMIRLGTMLAPTVTKLAHGVERIANALSGHGGATLSVMGALIALGPVMKAAGLGMKIMQARMIMTAMSTAGVSGGMAAATAATGSLTAALLASPITWIVLGLAAIAIGFYLLYTRVERFRNIVNATWSWIRDHWRLLAVIFSGGVGLAILMLIKHFKTLKRWAERVYGWIKMIADKVSSVAGPIKGISRVAGWATSAGGALGGAADRAERFLGGRAMGGPVYASGNYLVGERGPEIVRLPAGANVASNESLRGREMVTAPIVLKLDGRVIAETNARVVADRKARR